jgi:hypothetical protein
MMRHEAMDAAGDDDGRDADVCAEESVEVEEQRGER